MLFFHQPWFPSFPWSFFAPTPSPTWRRVVPRLGWSNQHDNCLILCHPSSCKTTTIAIHLVIARLVVASAKLEIALLHLSNVARNVDVSVSWHPMVIAGSHNHDRKEWSFCGSPPNWWRRSVSDCPNWTMKVPSSVEKSPTFVIASACASPATHKDCHTAQAALTLCQCIKETQHPAGCTLEPRRSLKPSRCWEGSPFKITSRCVWIWVSTKPTIWGPGLCEVATLEGGEWLMGIFQGNPPLGGWAPTWL